MAEIGPDLEEIAKEPEQSTKDAGVDANPRQPLRRRLRNLAVATGIGALRIFNLVDDPVNAAMQVLPPPPLTENLGERPSEGLLPYQVKVIDTQRQGQANKAAGSEPPTNSSEPIPFKEPVNTQTQPTSTKAA